MISLIKRNSQNFLRNNEFRNCDCLPTERKCSGRSIQSDQTLEDPLCQLSMVELMDTLFEDFNRYAFKYNQTEENRAFVVTCRRPTGDGIKEPSNMYQGYLQNSVWGMQARGDTESVRFSFIPPKFLYEDENAPKRCAKAPPAWRVNGRNCSPVVNVG